MRARAPEFFVILVLDKLFCLMNNSIEVWTARSLFNKIGLAAFRFHLFSKQYFIVGRIIRTNRSRLNHPSNIKNSISHGWKEKKKKRATSLEKQLVTNDIIHYVKTEIRFFSPFLN